MTKPIDTSRASWDRAMELARRWHDEATPLEKAVQAYAQRLSFVYGNIKLHNPALTRDMVQDIADREDGVVRSDT